MSAFEICDRCGTPVVNLTSHMHAAHNAKTDRLQEWCEHCGERYIRGNPEQRFCSHACANKANARSDGS